MRVVGVPTPSGLHHLSFLDDFFLESAHTHMTHTYTHTPLSPSQSIQGGMSLGAVTNVEQAINRGLVDADAHTTSIQAAESDMLLSQASISTATADIGALKETVVALVAAAAERASKLAATKGALKSAATLLTKTTADLTTVRQKVKDLEAEVEGSCGSACKAGTYVSTPCTDDEMHVCSACADGTFSLGGFPHACTLLSTCPAGTFVETAGSAGADTVCRACDDGKTFSTKENAAECKTCTAECDESFVVDVKCTAAADTVCKPGFSAFWATFKQTVEVEGASNLKVRLGVRLPSKRTSRHLHSRL